ncbi:hypothetical protein LJR220_006168 [Bradyrhizobium sp. LjRoot220]|uniref:DUF6600 domain-containing protein n=1 Tax=Bradyrhizobium sp. LjRoot220 TaxID=3342284 RepID=UPI003ED10A5B
MTIARKISIDTRTMLTAIFAAGLAALVFSASTPSAFAQGPAQNSAQESAQDSANVVPQQSIAKVQDDVRGVLTPYGRFVQHAKYGEVWIPTVTPQGWRPYPPCNWVNTRKYGWYYDDKTPWGAIVHHYGRWVSDAQMGWIWTPGAEFSPGWVVWRTSPEWVGWAPKLPDQDVQTVSAADFNSAAHWTFVETQKFAQGCNGAAPPQQIPVLLTQTTYVTDIRLVYGITVIVLPGYVVGPWIDIDIFFSPWPAWFLAQNLIDWNFIWNNLAVMPAMAPDCPQAGPKQGGAPKPLPVHNPVSPLLPRPDKPVDHAPPVVVVVPPPPICPRGTVMDHGVCRLPDFCRPGMVRVGNLCVFPTRPDPLPKPPVIDNPCAHLSGIELRRCLHVHRPHGAGGKPPVLGPVTGTGDGRPAGHQTPPTGGQPGHNPNVRIKEPVQLPNRLPPTTSAPMRPHPNPAVMAPSGGLNKTTVGAAPRVSNITAPRPLPVTVPEKKIFTR